jgi:hypothetical protein
MAQQNQGKVGKEQLCEIHGRSISVNAVSACRLRASPGRSSIVFLLMMVLLFLRSAGDEAS